MQASSLATRLTQVPRAARLPGERDNPYMEVSMNRSTLRNVIVGLAIVVLSLAPALAQMGPGPEGRGAGHGHGPGGPGMMMGRMAEALDLTADQRAQSRQIRAKYMAGAL